MLSEQTNLAGELFCTSEQAQTVGVPFAATIGAVKGLAVGLLSEQPVSIADAHPITVNRMSLGKLFSMNIFFPSPQLVSEF